MEELSGQVQKASTHASGIGVDIAIVECDRATVDADATSILPNNGGTSVQASTPSGRWGGFMRRKQSTYILRAHKGGTHTTVSRSKHPIGAMVWFHAVGSGQLTICEHTREPYIACQ